MALFRLHEPLAKSALIKSSLSMPFLRIWYRGMRRLLCGTLAAIPHLSGWNVPKISLARFHDLYPQIACICPYTRGFGPWMLCRKLGAASCASVGLYRPQSQQKYELQSEKALTMSLCYTRIRSST